MNEYYKRLNLHLLQYNYDDIYDTTERLIQEIETSIPEKKQFNCWELVCSDCPLHDMYWKDYNSRCSGGVWTDNIVTHENRVERYYKILEFLKWIRCLKEEIEL